MCGTMHCDYIHNRRIRRNRKINGHLLMPHLTPSHVMLGIPLKHWSERQHLASGPKMDNYVRSKHKSNIILQNNASRFKNCKVEELF